MTRTQFAKTFAKSSLLYLGLAAAVIAAIPLLVVLAYGVRVLVPVLFVAVLIALGVSPRFRRWFVAEANTSPHYHGVAVPTASLRVHPAHGWATIDEDHSAMIGIDALAPLVLGTISRVETLPLGSQVQQGQTLFTLFHGERRLPVKAPVGGVVASIHEAVIAQPTLLAKNPYGAGWVVRLEGVEIGKNPTPLKRGAGLQRWWKSEVDRLMSVLAPASPVATAADGGILSADLADHVDDAKWSEIAAKFF